MYKRNETGAIRNMFLKDHGIEIPRNNSQEDYGNLDYY